MVTVITSDGNHYNYYITIAITFKNHASIHCLGSLLNKVTKKKKKKKKKEKVIYLN
ncbi:hypothetical protein HYC85_020928 [Camellia sinensis]|uniref:Uncharacterized protein n=1 Tax=Camellia sinensis TaxID=4442 RepID=A0A7J7GUW2_CAMSI|nr:hypothetical protein HYC85_020928 [Camellia sinensis]